MSDEKSEIEKEDEYVRWDNKGDIKRHRPIHFNYHSTKLEKIINCEIKLRTPTSKEVDLEAIKKSMETFAKEPMSDDRINEYVDRVLEEKGIDQHEVHVYHFDPDYIFNIPVCRYRSRQPPIIVRDYD